MTNYQNNLAKINKYNREGNGARYGVNKFFDIDEDEFKHYLGKTSSVDLTKLTLGLINDQKSSLDSLPNNYQT